MGAMSGSIDPRKNRATPENGLMRLVRTAQSTPQIAAAATADTRNAMRATTRIASSVAMNALTREF